MARSEHHVVHNTNGGWDVKRNYSQRASIHKAFIFCLRLQNLQTEAGLRVMLICRTPILMNIALD